MEIVLLIIKVLGGAGLCYAMHVGAKVYAIHTVAVHPELSDQKVKYIAGMVTKDKHKNS